MDKEKKNEKINKLSDKIKAVMGKLTDISAGAVFKWDIFAAEAEKKFLSDMEKAGKKLTVLYRKIENRAAFLVDKHDYLQKKADRLWIIINYKTGKKIYETRKRLALKKKDILVTFSGGILIALAVVALFSYSTGYSYAYKGRHLGYVNNQADVLKVLDMVSDELSREHGTNIQIDKDRDVSFKRVYTMDKDIDDINTVLKRLTYMQDMQAEGYEILVNDVPYAICETKKDAVGVLDTIKSTYVEEGREDEYSKIEFKEDVKIEKKDVKLAYLMSPNKAIENMQESGLTVVTVEKNTFSEVIEYETEEQTSDDMYEGDSKVIQEGSNGKQAVTAILTKENGELINREDLEVEVLQEAVPEIVVKGTKPRPKTAPTGTFIKPVYGVLTSSFGWRWGRLHEGIDLAAPVGTVIRASDGGTVKRVGWYGGYGLCIEIQHGNGMMTRYGHCNAAYISVGTDVYQGQPIGEVGNTGNSTGSHCHFEIRVNGTAVDPFNYIN